MGTVVSTRGTAHTGILVAIYVEAHACLALWLQCMMAHKRSRSPGPWEDSGAETSDSSGPWGRPRATQKRNRTRTDQGGLWGKQNASASEGPWDSDASDSEGPWGSDASDSDASDSDASDSEGPWGTNASEPPRKATGRLDAANILQRQHGVKEAGTARKPTVYALRGTAAKNIKQRKEKGKCHCDDRKCHTRVSIGALIAVCAAYWAMTDLERALVIQAMYAAAAGNTIEGGPEIHRIAWFIGGVQVCFVNFCYLLGTGRNTIRNYVKGTWTPKVSHGRVKTVGHFVDWFFIELYMSAAEPLPHKEIRALNDDKKDVEITFEDKAWLDKGDTLNAGEDKDWQPDRPKVDVATRLTLAAQGMEKDVGLPVRFLPQTPLIHLYWSFVSAWDGLMACLAFESPFVRKSRCPISQDGSWACPSYATFLKRWHDVFKHYLRFRKTSQHAMCQTCFELQQAIHCARGCMAKRLDAARALRKHYADQYMDRCIYWSLREASRLRHNVLVIIIDSMDKAKFAWPRWPWPRCPKELQNSPRPRMVFTAAIAHGYCTCFFMASERINHGSDAFCEVLSRTIEEVARICKESGWKFPEHLVVQSDNTVAQAKNAYVNMFLAYLVGAGLFTSVTLNFLMVGHTHEDVGALVGLCSYVCNC